MPCEEEIIPHITCSSLTCEEEEEEEGEEEEGCVRIGGSEKSGVAKRKKRNK